MRTVFTREYIMEQHQMTWIAPVEKDGDKLFARCENNHPNFICLPPGRKTYYCKTCGALFVVDPNFSELIEEDGIKQGKCYINR